MEIEVLDELIEDIDQWSNFYIVSDDDSKQLAIFLGDELENQDISYSIIFKCSHHDIILPQAQYIFKNNLCFFHIGNCFLSFQFAFLHQHKL